MNNEDIYNEMEPIDFITHSHIQENKEIEIKCIEEPYSRMNIK